MSAEEKIKRSSGTQLRAELLEDAITAVNQDRQATHGSPESNFAVIAAYWTTWLAARGILLVGEMLQPVDVAQMMVLFKSARIAANSAHRDSHLDQAGYVACGYSTAAAEAAQ